MQAETTDMQSGPQQLRDWMERRGFNQTETAAFIGIDATYLSQVLNDVRTPGLTNALRIERHTGIPVESWAASAFGDLAASSPVGARKPKSGKA
jgi:transcriptional regulator with XRE-family HTH domain